MLLKPSVLFVGLAVASQSFGHGQHNHEWEGWEETSTFNVSVLDFFIKPTYAEAHISTDGAYRVIRSDGLPDHSTGRFPNRNNPNKIQQQNKTYRVPLNPEYRSQTTPLGMWPFGIALNGVVFDPAAAEFWRNDRHSGWQYEALGGAVNLGLDKNNAHVQPTGAYHYHGTPTGLLKNLSDSHGPILIGYAADGFPIYAVYGYKATGSNAINVAKLTS
ncbi:MAG: YHYH protein, partial [Pontibacterium sp.]